eukprot:31457-Pelagococcus_subviridis.AAC.29
MKALASQQAVDETGGKQISRAGSIHDRPAAADAAAARHQPERGNADALGAARGDAAAVAERDHGDVARRRERV